MHFHVKRMRGHKVTCMSSLKKSAKLSSGSNEDCGLQLSAEPSSSHDSNLNTQPGSIISP